jgi:CMP-N-acetylneuraminic acid synthetase
LIKKKLKILGIIPARGGSKEIKRKNLLKIRGKTLIELAIRSAKRSKMLTRTIFSSEDKKILNIAKKAGADIPFIRPKNLAKDNSPTFSVLKHAVKWLEKNENWKADIIVLLQPTTPFRKGIHIDAVVKLLLKTRSDAVITVKKVAYPSHWLLKIVNKDKVSNLLKGGNRYLKRQDTPQTYQPAGSVYAMTKKLLFSLKKTLPVGDTRGYIIPNKFAINIDNAYDYKLARLLGKNIPK